MTSSSSKKKKKRKRQVPLSSQSVPSLCKNITKLKTCQVIAHVHAERVEQHNQTFYLFWRHQNKNSKNDLTDSEKMPE